MRNLEQIRKDRKEAFKAFLNDKTSENKDTFIMYRLEQINYINNLNK